MGTHLHVSYCNIQYERDTKYIEKANDTLYDFTDYWKTINNPFNHNDIDHLGIEKGK
jgi:hypothetical protein